MTGRGLAGWAAEVPEPTIRPTPMSISISETEKVI